MFALPLEGLALSVTRKRQGQAEWIAQFTYFRKWRFDIQMAFAVAPNWSKMPPLMGSHGSVPCVFLFLCVIRSGALSSAGKPAASIYLRVGYGFLILI